MPYPLPIVSCSSEIRIMCDRYKDILGCHYKAFVAVLCGTIFGVANISFIFRFFLFSPSVSSISRLFNDLELAPKLNGRYRRRLKSILAKMDKDPCRYLWAVDDTLIPHWGKKIWGTYYWHDHNTKGSIHGHKLMVLGLVDTRRKTLIPVFWEILHREQDNIEHEKGWEVALRLLDRAVEYGFPPSTIVMDSWFSGRELIEGLTERGFDYVLEIKSNRIVDKRGRKTITQSVTDFFSQNTRRKVFYLGRKKWAAEAILKLKGLEIKLKIVAMANKKGLAHDCFAYYVSNKLTWDASKIWGISRDRWTIEVQFRELKQLFTLGGAAVRSKQAVEISLSISMIALTEIRLEQLSRADASKNQHGRPIPAISIVQEIQLRSQRMGLFKLANPAQSTITDRFQTRLALKNFRGKPTEGPKKMEPFMNTGS